MPRPRKPGNYTGVTPNNGRTWKAQLSVNGRTKYFGNFESKEDAARRVNEEYRKLHPGRPIPNPEVEPDESLPCEEAKFTGISFLDREVEVEDNGPVSNNDSQPGGQSYLERQQDPNGVAAGN